MTTERGALTSYGDDARHVAVFDATPVGPALATLLADVDPAALTPTEQVAFIAASERMLAWLQSRQNAGLVAFGGDVPRDQIVRVDGRAVHIVDSRRSEIALELHWSEQMAHSRLAAARVLAADLPETARALGEGRISALRAASVCQAAQKLTSRVDDLLGEKLAVDDRLKLACMRADMLSLLEEKSVAYACAHDLSRTRQQLRRVIAGIDPQGAAFRRAMAVRQHTDLTICHGEDGMSTITATMSSERAASCLLALDELALQPSIVDAQERIGVRRVAALEAALLGRPAQADESERRPRSRIHLNVTVDLNTLLGLRDESAALAGVGPIPAATMRELVRAGGASVRWLLTNEFGRVSDVSQTYRVGGRLRELIEARDGTCRITNCTRPATKCQPDHVTPFDDGGRSLPTNLVALCVRHHQLKTHCGFDLRLHTDGNLTIAPPHGHARTSSPEPVLPADAVSQQAEAEVELRALQARIADFEDRLQRDDEYDRTPTAEDLEMARRFDEALDRAHAHRDLAALTRLRTEGVLLLGLERVLSGYHARTCCAAPMDACDRMRSSRPRRRFDQPPF